MHACAGKPLPFGWGCVCTFRVAGLVFTDLLATSCYRQKTDSCQKKSGQCVRASTCLEAFCSLVVAVPAFLRRHFCSSLCLYFERVCPLPAVSPLELVPVAIGSSESLLGFLGDLYGTGLVGMCCSGSFAYLSDSNLCCSPRGTGAKPLHPAECCI